jgi:flagellar basal-body rod modification protein FlgD
MSTSAVNGASNVIDNYSSSTKHASAAPTNELGQSAFLELMIAQMNNQNPLEPQDNTEFVAQLAQFSTVEGMERLNANFTSFMSNNALQASSLVGRSVSVETDTSALFSGGVVSGSIELPYSTGDLQISIYDKAGALIQNIPAGTAAQGQNVFRWDGQYMEVNGNLLKWEAGDAAVGTGEYRFEVTALQNGKREAIGTNLSANINSVTIGDDGALILNLAGIGAVNVSEVKQFN